MDSITLTMFGFSFVLALVFTILGIFGATAEKKHPLDAVWSFVAMASWFFFAFLNLAFATDSMFYPFSYWYLVLGIVMMIIGFYCIFVNIHLSSEQRDANEMRLR